MQDLVFNTAVLSAAGTLLTAVIVFVILYLFLERKKKSLIVVFGAVLVGFGLLYGFMGRKHVNPLDIPKSVAVEHYPMPPQAQPRPIPVPKHRPRVKKAAKPVGPPLKLCQ